MFTSSDFSTIRTLLVIAAALFFVFRIARAGNRNTSHANTTEKPTDEDVVYYASSLISDGHAYFPDWSVMMCREYDHLNDGDLQRLFDRANDVAKHPKPEWHRKIRESLTE